MPEMMTMAPQPPPDGPRCQMVAAAAAAILSYPILLTQIVDLKPELGVTPLTARRTNEQTNPSAIGKLAECLF